MVLGKSTLLKCIAGLNKISSGELEVNGRIGYLPQLNEIQSDFPATVEEIVLSGTIGLNPKSIFYKKENKEIAKKAMERVQIQNYKKKIFSELSGGQKQRVLLARALCATDKLMLLDEPVNGLDPHIVNQIYDLIKELNEENGITIIMVSHDIQRALKYASRVIEINNGKIIFDDKPSKYVLGGNLNDRDN